MVPSKDNGLEVNAEKTNYMFTSRDPNVGRICNIKIDNISFERVEECRYQNLKFYSEINEEQIKSRNACYHFMLLILALKQVIKTGRREGDNFVETAVEKTPLCFTN